MNFTIEEQELTRVDNKKIASFAKDYVYAFFQFDDSWEGLKKYALFTLPDKTQIIEEIGLEQEAEIIIPFNALVETYVQISVFGKDDFGGLLTSTQEKIIIQPSGLNKKIIDEIFDDDIFVIESPDDSGKLHRLDRDIFWFISNKKLLHRNEHLYD